jgi:hypothetical protein
MLAARSRENVAFTRRHTADAGSSPLVGGERSNHEPRSQTYETERRRGFQSLAAILLAILGLALMVRAAGAFG